MKKSTDLIKKETLKKYAKTIAIVGANIGLDLDLGFDKKQNGVIFNNSKSYKKQNSEESLHKAKDYKDENSNSENTVSKDTQDKFIAECKNQNDNNMINYELLSNHDNLKNAILLKEILDNPRIERRRKKTHSRFRRGKI